MGPLAEDSIWWPFVQHMSALGQMTKVGSKLSTRDLICNCVSLIPEGKVLYPLLMASGKLAAFKYKEMITLWLSYVGSVDPTTQGPSNESFRVG